MKLPSYRNYLLVGLLLILAFNYVDRLALGLMLQGIKSDLSLSDTQLGVLSGIAFALFYSLMGIPIGRWADRGNRTTIISMTTALWSVAVALSGFAGSFLQLLLIRACVAVGEAGCVPPAHSLIATYFNRAERPRAVARYMLGAPLSLVIGYFFAGWLNEFYGWRTTFVILGLPGLALAVLARLTIKEPRGDASSTMKGDTGPAPGVGLVCLTLWKNQTFRHLLFCFAITSFFASGILQWQPAFFIRSFGLQTGELGTWFAVLNGIGGIVGTYWGGELAARRAQNNERLQLSAMAVGYAIFGVLSACLYLARDKYAAFTLLGLAAIGGAMASGPLFATIQTVVPDRMRAMSVAIIYFFSNLIGLGIGPLAAGALSDALRPAFDNESLRYALLALSPGYLWGAWHLWRASKTVAKSVEALRLEHEVSDSIDGSQCGCKNPDEANQPHAGITAGAR